MLVSGEPPTPSHATHENKKRPETLQSPALNKNPATTYSRAFGTTIGVGGLTTVFEMGTGVALRLLSPE